MDELWLEPGFLKLIWNEINNLNIIGDFRNCAMILEKLAKFRDRVVGIISQIRTVVVSAVCEHIKCVCLQ